MDATIKNTVIEAAEQKPKMVVFGTVTPMGFVLPMGRFWSQSKNSCENDDTITIDYA